MINNQNTEIMTTEKPIVEDATVYAVESIESEIIDAIKDLRHHQDELWEEQSKLNNVNGITVAIHRMGIVRSMIRLNAAGEQLVELTKSFR